MASVKVFRGDTWRRAWVLKDDGGTPVDLSGATARLHVRDASGAKVAEASTADGRLVVTAAQGRVDMTVPAAAMQLAPGAYRFDLELTYPGGVVQTIEQSTLVVLEDMSRD